MDNIIYIWAGLVVVAIIMEAISTQLISIWFVFGGIGGVIAALLGASVNTQMFIVIGISMLCLWFTRPIVKRKLDLKKTSTNADRYIGEKGIVIKTITNVTGIGQVKVKGQVWTACSEDDSEILEGTEVEVLRIEGVKVVVKPLSL